MFFYVQGIILPLMILWWCPLTDSSIMVGHRWSTLSTGPAACQYQLAGGPLATLFAGGGPLVVHQWHRPME